MKISSFFKNKERWPSCNNPRTLSFRAGGEGGTLMDDMFKTMNSVFFDPPDTTATSSSSSSSSGTTSLSTDAEESLETVVRAAVGSSGKGRLFFEPGSGDTSSILEETKPGGFAFKESVVLAMESEDPYRDFRKSMEEMVESHGVKDWGCLEELLGWYLRVNRKKHHEFIVGAFVDLLVGIASASNTNSSASCSSSSSSRCPNCSDSASFASAVSCISSSSFCPLVGGSSLHKITTSEIVEEAV